MAACILMAGGLVAGSLFAQEAERQKPVRSRDLDGPFASAVEAGRESDNPLARQQWFMHGRTVEHGSASEYLLRAYQQKMWQRAMRRMQTQTSATLHPAAVLPSPPWTNLGPAPLNSDWTGFNFQDYGTVSGRVTAVFVDQNDATGNTVYVGSAYGGVWKSTNGATSAPSVSWTPIIDSQATLAVNAITVQPGNSNTVLVGTGEPNNAIDSYYGLGVLRSTDGGITWTLINSTTDGFSLKPSLSSSGLGFTKFAWASPDNNNLVVAGLSSGDHAGRTGLLGDVDAGIIFSTDAGATWTRATFTGATANRVTDVIYNPVAKKFFAVMRNNGVFSSSDGVTWTKLAAQPGSTASSLYRGQFAMHPAKNEMYIWYVTNSGSTNGGIYQSLDGGATWTAIATADMDSGCGDGSSCGVAQSFYNLYLSAVPDGSATDLYAGAINIYKCQISSANPDCSKNAAGSNWLNLTHVYSCNPISVNAHVHPDQHGIDFSHTNPSIVYFGNDGGIYRTLNGPGLNNGTCSGVANPFDNLNATFGSTIQFYSLAGHPTDPTQFVGGTQDNGSPGVSSGTAGANGVTWSEVNGGDGGAVAIDPNNGNNWYMSNTTVGANIALYFSSNGVNTRAPGNGNPYLTSSSQLGGDAGDWVTPFKLDPADSTKIIIGTCRIWRGPANGTGWTSANAISNNFEFGSASICSSSSKTMIRTLAAGGPKTSNGSQVIYAGTELGHVFATTNADGGPSTWTDVVVSNLGTCSGYPCGYPISGIAIDPSDATGKTAYATAMGFAFPHVFKTTNGGATWSNITGNLVDAPANAVAVDPGNPAIVYVGTDVGVFATQDGGVTWAEYGTGFPNSAVVALDIFNSGSTHLLRAATHGRGVLSTTLGSAATVTGSLGFSPAFLTFLNQAVGGTSAAQTITVTAANGSVAISSIASSGSNFIVSNNNCITTVAAGASCTFQVSFSPAAAGTQTGSITVTSSGSGSPQAISVEGNGTIASGSTVTPETGWWWDSKLNGIGFFIEQNPTTRGIFMAGFLYDSTGKATWLVSTGPMSGAVYNGTWLKCTGSQSFLTTWQNGANCNADVSQPNNGAFSINFTNSQNGVMTRSDGSQINLTRFSFSTNPISPPQAGSPQNGWWWNAANSGTGYGIEIQGNAVFFVAYTYDSATPTTNPIWYLALGSTSTPTTYSGNWLQIGNGPQINSPETNCTTGCTATVNSNVAAVSFSFTSATTGTITMTPPGGSTVVIPITKFTSF